MKIEREFISIGEVGSASTNSTNQWGKDSMLNRIQTLSKTHPGDKIYNVCTLSNPPTI